MAIKKFLACILCAALLLAAFSAMPRAWQSRDPINFVVLGDSIAEGASALLDRNQYANRVAREKGYALQNFGRGGDTSHSLLHKVTQDEEIRQAIREADIVNVSIGGNDFYPSLYLLANGLLGDYGWMEPRRAALEENFYAAMDEIRALNKDALLVVQTLYNPVFSFMPPAAHEMYAHVLLGINGVIRDYLADNPGAYRIADVHAAFEGRHGLVFIDMVHPSALGHGVIAEVVIAAIDGTAPPSPGVIDRALDVPVMLMRPLILLVNWGIVGAVRLIHDRMPSVWAWLMEL